MSQHLWQSYGITSSSDYVLKHIIGRSGAISGIITGLEQIPALCEENGRQKARARVLRIICQELADKLNVFLNAGNYICWMEKGENGRLAMCAVPMELEKQLYQDI